MNLAARLTLTAALCCLSACGRVEPVGSRFVKSQDVSASEGAVITVTEADEPSLLGTRLDIGAGALPADTRITLELGYEGLVDEDGSGAGPVAIWGPAGTRFNRPVEMTLPYAAASDDEPGDLFVQIQEQDGTRLVVEGTALSLDAATGRVRFQVNGFTSFQVGKKKKCQTNAQCKQNKVCVKNRCTVAPVLDGGSNLQCKTDQDCPVGLCVNGQCAPKPFLCSANSDCGPNAQCVSGVCKPAPVLDGGSGLQCKTDKDCPYGLCVNGQCNPPPLFDGGSNLQCKTDKDCPNGLCVNGQCAPKPFLCTADSDCGNNAKCVSGSCLPVGAADAGSAQCNSSATCPPNSTCVKGICVP